MIKLILTILGLLTCLTGYAQSEISMFQLIKKPTTEYIIDSLSSPMDTVGELGNIFGDSIEVLGYCKITDTTDVFSIHINIGNMDDGSFNIYSDSLEYSLLPTVDTIPVYRIGDLMYFNFGVYPSTDTLYGEGWLYRPNRESSEVVYYPLFQ